MTQPTPLQGHPRPKVRHTWSCPRQAPLLETIRRTPTGQALVVTVCSHCEGDSYAEQLLEQARQASEARR